MKTCDSNCDYFPQNPSVIHKEYKDEDGVKHRKAEFYCEFDDHVIKDWCPCKNYK